MYEIFTRPDCIYCHKVKDLLASKKCDYVEHIIGLDISLRELKKLFPGISKLPIILKSGQMIGSFENLVDHLNPPLEVSNDDDTNKNINDSFIKEREM